uniref:YicC/YloC family endoribonuclease n=1 Tax=Megasphaera micronuciformis TaxID=187326 RepID=UPI0040268EB1
MRSMTGFGSGTYSDEKISITVEIKAVNQRFAEFNIRIPRTYAALEERVRRQLKDVIHRGKTDVFVTVTELSKEPPAIHIDFAALEAAKQALTEVKGRIFSEGEATFSETSALMSDWFVTEEQPTDTEAVWPKIQAATAEALTALTIMREREGKNIELDLSERAAKAEEYINFIDNHRADLSEAYGQRLHKSCANVDEDTGPSV